MIEKIDDHLIEASLILNRRTEVYPQVLVEVEVSPKAIVKASLIEAPPLVNLGQIQRQ